MKLIKFVVMLMVLCGSQLSHGEKLNCEFNVIGYHLVGDLYSCYVTSLDNTNNNMTITELTGTHMANENDHNVKGIWIDNKNTKYIPTNLGFLSNLTALNMESTQLIEIKSTDFHAMQELEHLSLWNNKLTSVPSNVFVTLTKLRIIILDRNQIEELPIGLFSNNLNLEHIYLQYNKIKVIGPELFNGLTKLDKVDLIDNICVSKYYSEIAEIIQLKKDIKMNCIESNANESKINNELSELRIETKDENRIKINEISEMMKQLLKTSEEQQNDRVGIEKLRMKLLKAKDDQQEKAIEMIEVVKERDLLKKQLVLAIKEKQKEQIAISDLKDQQQSERLELSTIKERNFKLEREVFNLYKEAFETKNTKITCVKSNEVILFQINDMIKQLLQASEEQQKERFEIEKLRTELSEAKDEQKLNEIEINKIKKDMLEAKEDGSQSQ